MAIAAAVLLLIPVFAACAASHDAMTDGNYGMMADVMDKAPVEYEYSYSESYDKVADDGLITNQYTSSSATGETTSAPAAGRKLIKNVTMELETREFEAFVKQMNDRVIATGGYIESSSVDGGRYGARGMKWEGS